jgi:hypothetical protein
MNKHNHEMGSVNPLLIASILLGLLAVGFAGAFFWSYTNYVDQRDNTSQKINAAVTEAKKAQTAEDEKNYLETAKQPYSQLVSPDDLGRVTVSYPKTWSVYVAKSNSTSYEAYLNPVSVPAVTSTQAFAARVTISDGNYEDAVGSYTSLVKKGDLTSAPITVNNFSGVKLEGKFSATRSGSAVIFKVRDKTLVIATDVDTYKNDFNNIIVKSLDFNP